MLLVYCTTVSYLDDAVSAAGVRRRPLRQELGRHHTRRVGARRQWRALRHRGCRALHVVLLGRCTAPRAAASAPAPAAAATSTTAATAATAFAAATAASEPVYERRVDLFRL